MTTTQPFHDEPRSAVIKRRLVTVSRSVALCLIITALLPILLVGAATVDVVRWIVAKRPWMSVRVVLFGWSFFVTEVIGLAWLLAVWLMSGFGKDRVRLVARTWPVQRWWARTLFAAVRRLFRIELEVSDHDVTTPGPIIAMFRHASIVDNLLPALLLTDAKQFRMRWIIKRELLELPSLDVAGRRLPNYFVDRNADDPRREIRAIRRLADDLEPDEGVLIYPEGTRFTERRRRRALADLENRSPALHERAAAMHHVLPPRVGGPLALLDSGYDVVLCGHEGLGGFARIGDVWSGALLGRTVRVCFWRIDAADIPRNRKARIDWLYSQWERIDAWIGAQKAT
ncbi:MAG TPA: 1-acyl-sn-glycerol-3-phosphate acyltransferase [Acidimicrobiia bacterium]|jgi:1-acyl-sn-glycerol-3-phosphate acyltransferase|nr:1-acyl-sn-glycerol-3-phosphate acyltransferase [Acidimicrobiia bacterium]